MQMSKNIMKYSYALLALIIVFSSCKKDYETIKDIDEAKIQAYITKNNLPTTKDPQGFYYQVLDPGTAGTMLNKDSVFYTVVVKSLNGDVYYSPAEFSNTGNYLGYVNPEAYRISLQAIKRGGKVRVIVPSYLAYGKNGNGPVPSNEVIVAELTTYPETTQWQIDDRLINQFLTAKGITATKLPSRVYIKVNQEGAGTVVNQFSNLTVKYTGRFLSGTEFDKTTGDATFITLLNQTVPGWRKALLGLKKGAKVRLLIPSDLGYGPAAYQQIPGNSILDFDIELVDVVD